MSEPSRVTPFQRVRCRSCGFVVADDGTPCAYCAQLEASWRDRGAPGGDYADWREDGGWHEVFRANRRRVAWDRAEHAGALARWAS